MMEPSWRILWAVLLFHCWITEYSAQQVPEMKGRMSRPHDHLRRGVKMGTGYARDPNTPLETSSKLTNSPRLSLVSNDHYSQQLNGHVHSKPTYNYFSSLPIIAARGLLPKILNRTIFTAMAEVGVQAGIFSEYMLRKWPNCKRYYMVDIWAEQKHYDDRANVVNTEQQKLYEEAVAKTLPYKDKVTIMRMYSLEAAAKLRKEAVSITTGKVVPFLDVVYLDARHDYCGCMEDIIAWWPLLKEDGILCGHDFFWKFDKEWNMCSNGTVIPGGVRAAVMDWARDNDLQVLTTQRERFESWFVRKPITIPWHPQEQQLAGRTVPIPGASVIKRLDINERVLPTLGRNFHAINATTEAVVIQKVAQLSYSRPITMLLTKFELGTYFQAHEPKFNSFVSVGFGSNNFHKSLLWKWDKVQEYALSVSESSMHPENPKKLKEFNMIMGTLKSQNASRLASGFRIDVVPSSPWSSNVVKAFLNALPPTSSIRVKQEVDVVFLDQEKDYCTAMRDILTWWPLLSHDGILMGTDFTWFDGSFPPCNEEGIRFILQLRSMNDKIAITTADIEQFDHNSTIGGVRSALFEWANANDLQVVPATTLDRPCNTWMVRKPLVVRNPLKIE